MNSTASTTQRTDGIIANPAFELRAHSLLSRRAIG